MDSKNASESKAFVAAIKAVKDGKDCVPLTSLAVAGEAAKTVSNNGGSDETMKQRKWATLRTSKRESASTLRVTGAGNLHHICKTY